jgi:hypothetical protein
MIRAVARVTKDAKQQMKIADPRSRRDKNKWAFSSTPFVAKTTFPEKTQVALFGDLHGALSPFLIELKQLIASGAMSDDLVVKPEHALVFCGDILDRGHFAVEVFALVLLLRKLNPGRVFVGRGNHEQDTELWFGYGFVDNLNRKFKAGISNEVTKSDIILSIHRVCSTLHVALFFSVEGGVASTKKWVLATHGGFEPSGSVKEFLGTALPKDPQKTTVVYAAFGAKGGPTNFQRKTWHKEYVSSDISIFRRCTPSDFPNVYRLDEDDNSPCSNLMYMWADMGLDDKAFWDGDVCDNEGRCILSAQLVTLWMTQNNVVTMFRGHQHSGEVLANVRA